jgi:lincosamide nucleotidyltransferase A/C/D/E
MASPELLPADRRGSLETLGTALYRAIELSPARRLLQTGMVRAYRFRTRGVGDMDVGCVVRLLDALAAAGLAVHLAGGWGVDALARRQTRLHDDLDVVYRAVPGAEGRLTEALAAEGFGRRGAEVTPAALFPVCLVTGDAQGRRVDLLPIAPWPAHLPTEAPEQAKGIALPHLSPEDFVSGLVGRGPSRRPVTCLHPRLQVAARQVHAHRRSDRHDLAVLRRSAGVS